MSKALKNIAGLVLAAGGLYFAAKYVKKYTDFSPANEEDLDNFKSSSQKTKDAAKRTYFALREGSDSVKEAAEDLIDSAKNVAEDAGKILSTAGENLVNTAKEEKEKFKEAPEEYKEAFAEKMKNMKEEAISDLDAVKAGAESFVNTFCESVKAAETDADDFVETEIPKE